jgi:hypothetical protein
VRNLGHFPLSTRLGRTATPGGMGRGLPTRSAGKPTPRSGQGPFRLVSGSQSWLRISGANRRANRSCQTLQVLALG